MPEPERVMPDIRGSDEVETAARQSGAMNCFGQHSRCDILAQGRPFLAKYYARRDCH